MLVIPSKVKNRIQVGFAEASRNFLKRNNFEVSELKSYQDKTYSSFDIYFGKKRYNISIDVDDFNIKKIHWSELPLFSFSFFDRTHTWEFSGKVTFKLKGMDHNIPKEVFTLADENYHLLNEYQKDHTLGFLYWDSEIAHTWKEKRSVNQEDLENDTPLLNQCLKEFVQAFVEDMGYDLEFLVKALRLIEEKA
jgi:hypothetical protein